MPTLYLIYAKDGELAGLERGAPHDVLAARREASRLLQTDGEIAQVEIWSGGELQGSVRG